MNGIPGDLYERLQTALLRCGPFDSDRMLRSLFVDARLRAWRDLLPEATSRVERARAIIDVLSERTNPAGENALVLLLRVLSEQIPPGDAFHLQLATLAQEVVAVRRADAPSSATSPAMTIIGDGNVEGNNKVVHIETGAGAGTPPAASPVDIPGLRARLQRLDAVDIESLCLDHFPEVYDKFARGLQRGEMINLLLDHCRRNPDDAVRLTKLLLK